MSDESQHVEGSDSSATALGSDPFPNTTTPPVVETPPAHTPEPEPLSELEARHAEYVRQHVEAKRKQWVATNTIKSPFVQLHTPEPSPQHIQTWTDEAAALARKEIPQ